MSSVELFDSKYLEYSPSVKKKVAQKSLKTAQSPYTVKCQSRFLTKSSKVKQSHLSVSQSQLKLGEKSPKKKP